MAELKPIAFMSYAHINDLDGRLTRLREFLSYEVEQLTGEKFHIFQDRSDLQWGQNWKLRIEDSIDGATFLIPIITPHFFKSQSCLQELERFIARERELGRDDLILSLYYIKCPQLEEPDNFSTDDMVQTIARRQWEDWQELSSPQFSVKSRPFLQKVTSLSERIMQALQRVQGPLAAEEAAPRATEILSQIIQSTELIIPPSGETGRRELVVDPRGDGHFSTITEAIQAANPRDRIVVRPGYYLEGLIIDKPLEIIGDGNVEDIVVQVAKANALLFEAPWGLVSKLTLRQMKVEDEYKDEDWHCVDIAGGRLWLMDCIVTSQSLACVAIRDFADPRLQRNHIMGGRSSGVIICENGQGVIEGNDVSDNQDSGVVIKGCRNITLRRNHIYDNEKSGVFIHGSRVTLEDNDIFRNGKAGVEIESGEHTRLQYNRIYGGAGTGVSVYGNGRVTLEENDVFSNHLSGIEIKDGGSARLRHNHVNGNNYYGIWVGNTGGGIIDGNDLRSNNPGSWFVSDDSKPNIRQNRNLNE